jgi:hypothetical protein
MLVLMVLYTVFSLWILNQPVVEVNEIAAVTTGGERSGLAWGYEQRVPYAASSRAGS